MSGLTGQQGGCLFLTRAEHDELLSRHPVLVDMLFKNAASREWSLRGVLFYGIPQTLINRVLDAQVTP